MIAGFTAEVQRNLYIMMLHDTSVNKGAKINLSLFHSAKTSVIRGSLSLGVLVIVSKLEELLSLRLLTCPSISAACCHSQHHCCHGYNKALPHRPGRLYMSETDVCFPLPAGGVKSESFQDSYPSWWIFHLFISNEEQGAKTYSRKQE